jgi:hypothetical protein
MLFALDEGIAKVRAYSPRGDSVHKRRDPCRAGEDP